MNISIRVPDKATSLRNRPYLKHDEFIEYCKANRVYISEKNLESLENKKLLSPCYRVLSPSELIRRKYRALDSEYSIRSAWEPIFSLKDAISKSGFFFFKEYDDAIKKGHPLEQAVVQKNPFVKETGNRFVKDWRKYDVFVERYKGEKLYESKAEHYYSVWKIFIVDEINTLNTISKNLATNIKRGRARIDKKIYPSTLLEFSPFFKKVYSLSYRRNLIKTKCYEERRQFRDAKIDWDNVNKKIEKIAQELYPPYPYKAWIIFLRKLIAVHEDYIETERYLLGLEIKSAIGKTVGFLQFSLKYDFMKICDDVSGEYKKTRSRGMEDGILLYPGVLEKMFPDEKWDLQQNVKYSLDYALKSFNSFLEEKERIPDELSGQMLSELSDDPEGTALSAIRRIKNAYGYDGPWKIDELWSGIRDLAISIEVHGKKWIGGQYLNNVLQICFKGNYDNYDKLKKDFSKKITDAHSVEECLSKLKELSDINIGRQHKRNGRHLLVANLIRNYSVHQKILPGNKLSEYFNFIYNSLVRTLFIIYAVYKKV